MRKLVAGNWKMHKGISESDKFLQDFLNGLSPALESSVDLLIFPQSTVLPLLSRRWGEIAGNRKRVLSLGIQNMHWEAKGAFTGEVAPQQAKEAGAEFVLAGHSERRQFFGETNESAVQRALAAHAHGMTAVFCVGERLEERDAGRTFQVLEAQMAPLFAKSAQAPQGFNIAYEPVWAIGTGRTATSAQAEEAHAFLRQLVIKAWGKAPSIRLLYGGSVKPDNAAELMGCPNVDGVLVGGASLEAASFLAIAAGAVK